MKNLCLNCVHYIAEPGSIKTNDGTELQIGGASHCLRYNWYIVQDSNNKPDVSECASFEDKNVDKVENLQPLRLDGSIESGNDAATKTILDLLNSDTLRIEKNIK